MLINARLSDRSLARWRRVPGFARQVLGGFTRVQARSADRRGAAARAWLRPRGRPGDLKLAAAPLPADEAELQRLREMLAGRPVWLAASTHPGEETLILAVHRGLAADHPGLLTIIAPRHPGARRCQAARPAASPVARRVARRRRRRRGASGSPIRWANSGCCTGWPASPSSAAACCRRAAARTRWSRRGLAAPSRSGRIPATSPTMSRCCACRRADRGAGRGRVGRWVGRAAPRPGAATAMGEAGRGRAPAARRPAAPHCCCAARPAAAQMAACAPGFLASRRLAAGPAVAAAACHRRRHGTARGAAGLARAGAGDLLRQRHRRRCRQDHAGARSRRTGWWRAASAVHFLLRGYGGSGARHRTASPPATLLRLVGDEALLLAEVAPTWIGADRAASARAAIAAGAQMLVHG